MDLQLLKSATVPQYSKIQITGSKSESNRLLILQALLGKFNIDNLSNSDDTNVLQKALGDTNEAIVDIHHAGTAMRFLTAYFSVQEGRDVTLTGSSRMQERPIRILVDALKELDADIVYENEEGYPPIKIKGKKINKNRVTLKANVSSQYISALLLIGGVLENGIELILEGEITSVPYIKMTLSLLNELGIDTSFKENVIQVNKINVENIKADRQVVVESDWSSASYFYSIVALSEIGTSINLSSYKENSLQGDSCLAELYKQFGVQTLYKENEIELRKISNDIKERISFSLVGAPDIAQTIAVTSFGLDVECDLYGLHTLKIKETDRLLALQEELKKLGAIINVTEDSLHLKVTTKKIKGVTIKTYQDHRMAMAFAPLALKIPINISEADVVSKSYPDFWKDMNTIGIQSKEI